MLEQAASELEGSDAVRYYLVVAYHDAAIQSGTPLPNGGTIMTTSQQASYSEQMVKKAQAVGLDDPELRTAVDHLAGSVRYALGKHWAHTPQHSLKWCAILFVLFVIFVEASPAAAVLVLAGAGLWIYLGLQPGWKINHKQMLATQPPSGPRRPPV